MTDGVALSALDWWAEAGVDVLADDLPRNWLASPSESATANPAPAPAVPVAKPVLPQDLGEFRKWLLADASVPGPPRARLDACGDAAGGIVIVIDMPEANDRTAGSLLSGEIGALFDRMLGAIGLARDGVYLLPLSPARPTTGRLRDSDLAVLTPLLLHHLTLVTPKRLLLLGDAPAQALLQRSATKARETVHQVRVGDREVPTIVSIHPRIVNTRDYRQLAWADLQLFQKS